MYRNLSRSGGGVLSIALWSNRLRLLWRGAPGAHRVSTQWCTQPTTTGPGHDRHWRDTHGKCRRSGDVLLLQSPLIWTQKSWPYASFSRHFSAPTSADPRASSRHGLSCLNGNRQLANYRGWLWPTRKWGNTCFGSEEHCKHLCSLH